MNDETPLPPGVGEAMRTLALDRATATAVDALTDAAIPSLLLKGISTARWIYPEESARPYTDVDLLVPPGRLADAEAVLGELGFRRGRFASLRDDWPKHAVPLGSPDGLSIDLHRTFVGVGATDEELWREMETASESIELGGSTVRIPAQPRRAFVLALHAAKDGAYTRKARADIDRAVEVLSLSVWREAVAVAQRLDALAAFAQGLRRTERGRMLAETLALPADLPPALALRQDPPPPLAVGMDWMLHSGGVRGKGRLALRKVFPPREFMRAWSPIAQRGTWGLALAYAGRPFWILWRFVPAYLAVRRARREPREGAGQR